MPVDPAHVPSQDWADPGGPTVPPPESNRQMVPWLLGLVAIVAIVAFVAMVILNQGTRSDLDDSKDAVSTLAGDLARARGDIEEMQDQLADTEADLTAESRNVREVQDQLSELDSVASDFLIASFTFAYPERRPTFRCTVEELGAQRTLELMMLAISPYTADLNDLGAATDFADAYVGCGGDLSELDDPSGLFGGDPGVYPEVDGPGDDPGLDALYDDCADGDMAACDELYWSSPFDSEYERFGHTCGDRVAELDLDELCVDTNVAA